MYLLNQYNKKHLYIDLYYEYINKLHWITYLLLV
jgi:hypothetical protein